MGKVVVTKKKKTTVAKRSPVTAQGVEIFTTTPETINVPKTEVLLLVNGSNKGQVAFGRQNLAQFVISQAQERGIRNFSVYVDDQKGDTSMAQRSLADVSKVEIVSKDARG